MSLKVLLIILAIIAIAIFTGTWIFDICAWISGLFESSFAFLGDIFNLFGWNSGIIASASTLVIGGVL